jgi:hypothetical protein
LFYVTYPEGSALPPELGGPPKRTAVLSKSNSWKIRTAPLSKSTQLASAAFPPHLGWTHGLSEKRRTRTVARADAHKWEFKVRFRRHAFGWKSQPAIARVKQAVAEIKQAAKNDPVVGAEGAITLH